MFLYLGARITIPRISEQSAGFQALHLRALLHVVQDDGFEPSYAAVSEQCVYRFANLVYG
jgi:hypothetical protein